MNRRWKWTIAASIATLGISSGAFFAGRALASGIPASNALVYSGTLEDGNGVPLSGARTIELRLWNAPTGGTTPLCTTLGQQVTLDNGRFSLALPETCTAQIKANPETYVEVLDGTNSLGRSKVGAVPYAVEAGNAISATMLGSLAPADVQKSVTGACPAGSSIRAIAANGTVTCQSDANTTYTGASGVAVSGTTISADTGFVQRRVSGSCAAGSYIRAIAADGTVTCQTDASILDVQYERFELVNRAVDQTWLITPRPFRFCALSTFNIVGLGEPNKNKYCAIDRNDDGTWILWARGVGGAVTCEMHCF